MTAILETPVAGIQTPRISHVPAYVDNDYRDAIDLITVYEGPPDYFQELLLEAWLGRRPNGLWAAPANGGSVPRQNGKNYALEARELYGMVVLKERILHTAHEVRTSKNHFKRMLKYFGDDGHPDLKAMVSSISKTNGEEAIYLKNGAELRFVSRSKRAARGFSSDLLVIDEAQELDDDSYEAILPIISASPNPQQILTGTPPGPTANGEVFTRMRKDGVEGNDLLLSWLEWSAEKNCDLDSEETWAQANPGYPHRISAETITTERSRMSDDSFGRERLGMWTEIGSTGVIDMDLWSALGEAAQMEDPVVFAIDVNWDRTRAAISVAGYLRQKNPDTQDTIVKTRINAIADEAGIDWVVDRMVALTEQHRNLGVVIDAGSPASSLILKLKRKRVKVIETGTRDMTRACGDFMDMIRDGTLSHGNQASLTNACAVAKKRKVGDAWAWDRNNHNEDISPLVAASLAAYGLSLKKRPTQTTAETPERRRSGITVM